MNDKTVPKLSRSKRDTETREKTAVVKTGHLLLD